MFLHHALDLLQEVAVGPIRAAGIELKDIGAIVVNTITGVAIPSLDAKLMNRLDLASVVSAALFGDGRRGRRAAQHQGRAARSGWVGANPCRAGHRAHHGLGHQA